MHRQFSNNALILNLRLLIFCENAPTSATIIYLDSRRRCLFCKLWLSPANRVNLMDFKQSVINRRQADSLDKNLTKNKKHRWV